MSELYCVEVSGAPVREQRFATFLGNEYSGFQCVQFVQLSKVIYKDPSTGQMTSHKGLSWCQRITDDLQQAVKDGWTQTWLATARVVKYIPATHSFQVIYVGKTDTTAAAEPTVPKAMLASDGTWRKIPTTGFSKGPREWALAIAFVDSTNRERASVNPNFTGQFYNLQKNALQTPGVTTVPYFNPAAFQIGPLGQLGNAPRESISGPNLFNMDFSVMKRTTIPKLGETSGLELRGDFFNVLNHTNFGLPNNTIFNGTAGAVTANAPAGRISTIIGTARQLQFSARFVF